MVSARARWLRKICLEIGPDPHPFRCSSSVINREPLLQIRSKISEFPPVLKTASKRAPSDVTDLGTSGLRDPFGGRCAILRESVIHPARGHVLT